MSINDHHLTAATEPTRWRATDGTVWREATPVLLVMTRDVYGKPVHHRNSDSVPRTTVELIHGALSQTA